MPDFLIAPCEGDNANCKNADVTCKKSVNELTFGLCDDPPPDEFPAYIQNFRPEDWIAVVNNPNKKSITFKAIDKCVPIVRTNGEVTRRCDGILIHAKTLHFVELKNASYKGWVSEAMEQLLISIEHFIAYHNATDFIFSDAYICNKQRPMAVTSINSETQRFKDITANLLYNNGLKLIVSRNIEI